MFSFLDCARCCCLIRPVILISIFHSAFASRFSFLRTGASSTIARDIAWLIPSSAVLSAPSRSWWMDPWHWRLFCLLFCVEVYFLLSEIRTYTTPTIQIIQNPQPECMYAMNVRCWYIHKVFNWSILKQVLVVADRLVYTCSVHTLFIFQTVVAIQYWSVVTWVHTHEGVQVSKMIQSGHVISLYHWSAPAIFSLSCTLPIWWCTAAHCCGKESIYSDLNVCLLAPRKSSLFAFLPAGDSHVVSIHFANVVHIFDSFPIGCCVQWFCTFGACCESPGMNLEPHFSWADAVQAEILRAQVCVWWGKAEHSGHRTFCLTRHQGEIFHQEMPLRLIYCIDSRMMGLSLLFFGREMMGAQMRRAR